ncbi:MAG: alkaline phosphatase family protein [Actinomycetota bacterium]|nr:alkaline phosphatase family protein [Actinomycetota bacterium]
MRLSSVRGARAIAVTLVLVLGAAACTGGDDKPKTDGAGPSGPQAQIGKASPFPSPAFPVPEPAADWLTSGCDLPLDLLQRVRRDYNPERSAEVVAVPRAPNFMGGYNATSHSGPWDYIQRVPIVLYGPGFIRAQGKVELEREATVADLAPTLADLLDMPWPEDRPSRSLSEALLPEAKRNGTPRVIVTIVWDGGGWDVLETWPDSWPHLASLMADGTAVTNGIAGSSPSVTPAIHANIGTGAFPKQHGIVDIPVRDGDDVLNSYPEKSPRFLGLPTVADLWDLSTGNAAQVGMLGYKGWHIGMMGQGGYLEGADKDLAAFIANSGEGVVGAETWYELPDYLDKVSGIETFAETIDAGDGKRDGRWLGHDTLKDPFDLRHTPAAILYQTELMLPMLGKEGFGQDEIPDLFYVNYKPIDTIGHSYNMVDPEVRDALLYADEELKEITRYLDDEVGKNKWVVAITADHGQTPSPDVTGAWAISQDVMMEDVAEQLGLEVKDIFQEARPTNFWLQPGLEEEHGVTAEEVADIFLQHTISDNVTDESRLPDYEGRLQEPVIEAAFPYDELGRIWKCATSS